MLKQKQIGHIITGWAKAWGIVQTSKAEEKLSELRMRLCRNCPFVGESETLRIINGTVSNNPELYCRRCGCPCQEKTVVTDETCPENLW